LVECLQGIIREHADDNLKFKLLMLIPTEPTLLDSDYTIIISAPWLDKRSPKEAIGLVIQAIIRQCGGTTDSLAYRKTNRITPIRSDDPFVNQIASGFSVSIDNPMTIQNYTISGFLVERAILLESHADAA